MTLGRTLLMADEQVLRAYHLMVTYNVWLDDVRYYSTEDFSDFLEKLNFYTQHHEALGYVYVNYTRSFTKKRS